MRELGIVLDRLDAAVSRAEEQPEQGCEQGELDQEAQSVLRHVFEHPIFDTAWYLAQHPDVRQRQQNPLVHYLTEGWRSGFAPHPQFDGELYLARNPDVKAADANPLEHYVRHGEFEARAQPLPPA